MDLVGQRLGNQRLVRSPLRDPAQVVSWLGAVQSQDYAGAKWALAQRMKGTTDRALDEAFNRGSILRTHVMRPTWHFVSPADIRWLLALTAPRVHTANASSRRQLEIDPPLVRRTQKQLQRLLGGRQHQTRTEIGLAFARAGVDARGLRLGYLMMQAELDGLICSGPRRGNQFTYALLDERVPPRKALTRDEALAGLTLRYFSSHGPATVRDFVWWSGLTVREATAGIAMIRTAIAEEIFDGRTYWFRPSRQPILPASPFVYLLPNYDEYFIAYKDRAPVLPANSPAAADIFAHQLVVDGRLAGAWRRTIRGSAIHVDVHPYAPLGARTRAALGKAVEALGRFLGMKASLVVAGR